MKRNCHTSLLKLRCYHLFIHSHFAGSLETLCFEARGVKKITVIFQQVKKKKMQQPYRKQKQIRLLMTLQIRPQAWG